MVRGKTENYRYRIFEHSRGDCPQCGLRKNSLLIRIREPFKEEVRICHDCFFLYILEFSHKQREIEEKQDALRNKTKEPDTPGRDDI